MLPAIRHTVKNPKGAVIFIHGLGDSGQGWEFLHKELNSFDPEFFNQVDFVFPNAPQIPVTVNMGTRMPAWFDIYEFASDPNKERKEDISGFLQSIEKVKAYIAEQNVPKDKIVLGGFSQGGALTFASSVLLEEKLAGFVVLSGFAGVAGKLQEKAKELNGQTANLHTPILQCHGTADPVIPYGLAEKSKDLIKGFGYDKHKFLKFNGLGHSCNEEELRYVCQFIKGALK